MLFLVPFQNGNFSLKKNMNELKSSTKKNQKIISIPLQINYIPRLIDVYLFYLIYMHKKIERHKYI